MVTARAQEQRRRATARAHKKSGASRFVFYSSALLCSRGKVTKLSQPKNNRQKQWPLFLFLTQRSQTGSEQTSQCSQADEAEQRRAELKKQSRAQNQVVNESSWSRIEQRIQSIVATVSPHQQRRRQGRAQQAATKSSSAVECVLEERRLVLAASHGRSSNGGTIQSHGRGLQ
jgi:hypothetical protein